MNAISAGVAGALISGLAMYTVGAKAHQVDAFTPAPAAIENAAPIQNAAPQFIPVSYPGSSLRPVAAPAVVNSVPVTRPAPRRSTSSARDDRRIEREREVAAREDVRDNRSWSKTAMVIGGSAASGAGVGGIVAGKKGALIGAAIGGGAASIFEASRDDR
jgi:hypothetical protein